MKRITQKIMIELVKFPGGGEQVGDTGGGGGNTGGEGGSK